MPELRVADLKALEVTKFHSVRPPQLPIRDYLFRSIAVQGGDVGLLGFKNPELLGSGLRGWSLLYLEFMCFWVM